MEFIIIAVVVAAAGLYLFKNQIIPVKKLFFPDKDNEKVKLGCGACVGCPSAKQCQKDEQKK